MPVEPAGKVVRFYVLFSGGPDSTALALTLKEFSQIWAQEELLREVTRILKEALPKSLARKASEFFRLRKNIDTILLHLNHKIRPSADADAEWVQDFARRNSFGCHVESINVPELAKKDGLSLEEVGRRERYALMARFLEEEQTAIGFTGHTLDDHAESVIFNLVERTGFGGLLGISPALHGRILRPFLTVTKEETQRFLKERRVPFLVDESNLVPERPRTFIRHEIMPRLLVVNPRAKENILATSENLRSYEGLFAWAMETIGGAVIAENELLKKALAIPLLPGANYYALDVTRWKAELKSSLSTILKHITEGLGFGTSWEVAKELSVRVQASESFYYDLGAGRVIEFHPPTGMIFLVAKGDTGCKAELMPNARLFWGNSVFDLGRMGGERLRKYLLKLASRQEEVCFASRVKPSSRSARRAYEALLSGKVPLPLVVRNFERGDRVALPNRRGSAKLSDLFINKKLPRAFRESIPVICDSKGGILWVPGIIRSGRFWVKNRESSAYRLRVEVQG